MNRARKRARPSGSHARTYTGERERFTHANGVGARACRRIAVYHRSEMCRASLRRGTATGRLSGGPTGRRGSRPLVARGQCDKNECTPCCQSRVPRASVRLRHIVSRGRILTRVRVDSATHTIRNRAGIAVTAARRQNASAVRRYAGKTLNLPSLCSMRHVQLVRVRRKGRARVASRGVVLRLPRYGAAHSAPESTGATIFEGTRGLRRYRY